MPRVDRKVKRELTRSMKARNLRETKLKTQAYDLGVSMGIQYQQAKVAYSTLHMGYLYEYPVTESGAAQAPVSDSGDSGNSPTPVTAPVDRRYDYPDADAIPA